MNIYLLTQNINNGYDTYDSCVVAASSSSRATLIHPSYGTAPHLVLHDMSWRESDWALNTWARPTEVKAVYLGKAKRGVKENEVICSSFNAG